MVPYCYLFLLSVFILWFSYYVSDIFCKLLSVYIFSYFPLGFEGRMWDLIVSVPDHCISFYFVRKSESSHEFLISVFPPGKCIFIRQQH